MLKTRDEMERVGAGGQGFVQDAVAPDVFEADAARLVLVEEVGGTRPVPRALMRESRTCRFGGVRPGGAPVSEPGQQSVAGELAEALPLAGEGDARAGQVDVVQGKFADGPGAARRARLPARWPGAGRESRPPAGRSGSPRQSSAAMPPAPRPPLRCRAGSANVRPCRLVNRNSERSAMSSSLNRRCLPMNVHGINRAAAFVLSHDSRTLRMPAPLQQYKADPPLSHCLMHWK